MQTVELERKVVKSPPELWDELASEHGLRRWLGQVEVRATDSGRRLEWNGGGASGAIELEASGWGTRVRARAFPEQAAWDRLLGRRPDAEIEERLSALLDHLGASSLTSG
jgi:hypothetical protein